MERALRMTYPERSSKKDLFLLMGMRKNGSADNLEQKFNLCGSIGEHSRHCFDCLRDAR